MPEESPKNAITQTQQSLPESSKTTMKVEGSLLLCIVSRMPRLPFTIRNAFQPNNQVVPSKTEGAA